MDANTIPFPVVDPEQGADIADTLQRVTFIGFDTLPLFDIRNGQVADATSILVRPTIPASCYWAPVGGVSFADCIRCVDGFIRTAWAQSFVMAPANETEAKKRKKAIILGVSRAVMTTYYRLTAGDLIAGEVADVMLNATVGANGAITYSCPLAANDPRRAHVMTELVFTAQESAVITQLILSSIGIPPMQGWSLHMTGHHYISEANSQSRKQFKAVEGQFWVGSGIGDWFNQDVTDLQDFMWHKAGHPISLTLKKELSESTTVVAMLKAAGAGSAAARLPALESPLRAAGSYLTLMQSVDGLLAQVGGRMDPGLLPDIVFYTKNWPRGGARPVNQVYNDLFPADIVSREMAVDWVEDLLSRNQASAAWAYGFYLAVTEASPSLGGVNNTLKASFSLEKLRQQSLASFVEGNAAYSDYAAKKQQDRMAGRFVAPQLGFKLD